MDKYEHRRLALQALIASKGRGGINAVATATGIDPSYVSRMLYEAGRAGRKRIGEDLWEKLTRVFPEIEPGQAERDSVLPPENAPGYVRFELFEGGAGMGLGVVNQDYPEVVKTIEVAEWEVRRKLGFLPRPGRIQLITGRGPSMRPKLEDGDIVWIDTSCNYFDGDDYYLISISGETQIKMLQQRNDGLYVVSVNTDFPAYRADVEELGIMGKALIHAGLRKF